MAVRRMSFHGEILSCISCHSMGRSVMCLMSFHGEICHVFHVIPWGDLSHLITWGDLSCFIPWRDLLSCHSMGRSVIFFVSFYGEIYVRYVMCLMSFHGEICHKSHVILWGDQCQICLMSFHGELCHVHCHFMGDSMSDMCLMHFHGEIFHVHHVILWGDLHQICHVFYIIPLDLPSLVTSQTSKGHVLT